MHSSNRCTLTSLGGRLGESEDVAILALATSLLSPNPPATRESLSVREHPTATTAYQAPGSRQPYPRPSDSGPSSTWPAPQRGHLCHDSVFARHPIMHPRMNCAWLLCDLRLAPATRRARDARVTLTAASRCGWGNAHVREGSPWLQPCAVAGAMPSRTW